MIILLPLVLVTILLLATIRPDVNCFTGAHRLCHHVSPKNCYLINFFMVILLSSTLMSIRPGCDQVKSCGNGVVSARLHLQEAPSHYPRHVPQNTFVDANDFIHPGQQMSSDRLQWSEVWRYGECTCHYLFTSTGATTSLTQWCTTYFKLCPDDI